MGTTEVKVLRKSDKVWVNIDGVKFRMSPLSYSQMNDIRSSMHMDGGKQVIDEMKMVFSTLKFSVKEVKGVSYHDGSPMKLEFEDDGTLTTESIDEVLAIPNREKLLAYCATWYTGNKTEIDGVEVTYDTSEVGTVKKG